MVFLLCFLFFIIDEFVMLSFKFVFSIVEVIIGVECIFVEVFIYVKYSFFVLEGVFILGYVVVNGSVEMLVDFFFEWLDCDLFEVDILDI